jgi:hypothetical protein
MNKQEFTIAKFQICSEIDQATLVNWATSAEFVPSKLKVDIPEFKKILIKVDMEEYTSLLVGYLSEKRTEIYFNQKFQPQFRQSTEKIEQSIEYGKDIAEALYFLSQYELDSFTAIKISNNRDMIEIRNKTIVSSIIKAILAKLMKDFKKDSGDIDFLTFEEAKAEVISQKEPQWITQWNSDHKYFDELGKKIFIDENIDNENYRESVSGEYMSGGAILNLLIEDYAFAHEIKREITLEYLEKVKTKEPKEKGKRGAPEKYSSIKPIMQVLADLRRAERLFRNLDKGINTNNYRLKNPDYRFINDCLVIWGLKEDISTNRPITTTIEKALREIFDPSDNTFLSDKYPKLISLRSTP